MMWYNICMHFIVPPPCEVCNGPIPRRLLRPGHTARWCGWECRTAGGHRGPSRDLPDPEPHPCLACGEILTDRRKYCDTSCRDNIEAGAPKTWRDRHSPEELAPKTIRNQRYLDSHPGVDAAHRAVARALEAGRLVRGECCEACGVSAEEVGPMESHHESYDKAHRLDVLWLCPPCHKVADRERRQRERERLALIPGAEVTPDEPQPAAP